MKTNGNWIDKIARGHGRTITTTMFPRNWSKQRIMEEVSFAFNDGSVDFLIKVEEPYSYLGTMFEGKEKREDV